MCDWAAEAADADLLVLNRGMHYAPDEAMASQLLRTFEELRRGVLSRRRVGVSEGAGFTESSTSPPPRWPPLSVVYRGTHAPIPSCHVLDDPLPAPFQYDHAAAHDATMRAHHWADFGRQNGLAAELAARHNLTFLDVHYATSLRPGGHMPSRKAAAGDCAHYCLPGPIDEWVKLLLALWT